MNTARNIKHGSLRLNNTKIESMKTALTELIEDFESRLNFVSDSIAISVWERAVELLKEKLPQERQQIEDALLYGHAEATHTSPVIDLSFTDRYFTEKFE